MNYYSYGLRSRMNYVVMNYVIMDYDVLQASGTSLSSSLLRMLFSLFCFNNLEKVTGFSNVGDNVLEARLLGYIASTVCLLVISDVWSRLHVSSCSCLGRGSMLSEKGLLVTLGQAVLTAPGNFLGVSNADS